MPQIAMHGAAMGWISKVGAMRSFILFFAVGVCVLTAGCKESQAIWSDEAKSPDGKMLATARSFANGGFGVSGAPATFVYLNWATGSQKPMQVLSLESEFDTPDEAKVGMKWLSPSHLELTYQGNHQHIDFQAVKFVGIDISVRDLANPTSSMSTLQ